MDVEGVIVDVDGTVLRGGTLVSGARDAVQTLRDAGYAVGFLSNNPTATPDQYREKLVSHGVPVETGFVLTAAGVTASFLADRHPTDRIYVVGDDTLVAYLRSCGVTVTDDPEQATVLLGSIDTDLAYEDLKAAISVLERDVPFYGTDPDPRIPTDDGTVPGTGMVLASLEAAGGRPPDAVLGKPSRIAATAALERLETPAERTLVVGDRLDTDVALGQEAGMHTVLVETGIDDRSSAERATDPPDHVVSDLNRLPSLLEP